MIDTIQVWSDCHHKHFPVAIGSDKYNGYTIDEIKSSLDYSHLTSHEKKLYISNCKKVINSQITGHNLSMILNIEITNFSIIKNSLKS